MSGEEEGVAYVTSGPAVTGQMWVEPTPPVWVVTLTYCDCGGDAETVVHAVVTEDPGQDFATRLSEAFQLTGDDRRHAHVQVHRATPRSRP